MRLVEIEVSEVKEVKEIRDLEAPTATKYRRALPLFLYLLYFLNFLYLGFLIAARPRQCVDERAGTRRVVPHLKRGVKVEDVAGREPAAGAVDRKHRVAIDFVEVDVFEHGASPVREIEKIDAGLIGVHAGLDRDPAHRLAPAEEQVEIVAVACTAFLDNLADGDAQIFPGVFLLDGHVGD